MSSEIAVFEVSKSAGFLEISFEFVIGSALLLLASYGVAEVEGFELWFGVFAVYGAAVIFLSRVILRLRYRYIFAVRYTVGTDGIVIEQAGTKRIFSWSEVSKAEFLWLTPTYRLWVPEQPRPVVLILVGGLPGGRLDHRNRLAKSILKQNLGTSLKTSWLPW